MTFEFRVVVEVERIQGKFVSRDEITEVIAGWLEAADETQVDVAESQYETVMWEVMGA